MKRFYVNKYPINCGMISGGKNRLIEVGTSFTIIGIAGNMFELEPVYKIEWLEYPVLVDPLMLERAFFEQEHVIPK